MADLPAREAMEFDVVIVGAGPAGLSAAIRLKQINPDISVVIVEKGSEVGAHILSGAVIDPVGLDKLLPEWRGEETPVKTAVSDDRFYWLSAGAALRLPNFAMPPLMNNHGNFIVSLGSVCRWLAGKAVGLGVEIYPGFAAAEVLFDEHGAVAGVATGDMGVGKGGAPKDAFTRGMELRAREAPQGGGAAVVRLAARWAHRRWLVSLSLRRQSGVGRLRAASQLHQSVSVAVRGIPALQDPQARARHFRGRQKAGLWRARTDRRRLPVGAQARVPRRRADWLRCRLHERAAQQGQP